jgi:hypothetical protein
LHFGQIGDAAATNASRGPPSTLFSITPPLQRLNPTTDAAQREEDVPRGELDLEELGCRVTVIAKALSSSF